MMSPLISEVNDNWVVSHIRHHFEQEWAANTPSMIENSKVRRDIIVQHFDFLSLYVRNGCVCFM